MFESGDHVKESKLDFQIILKSLIGFAIVFVIQLLSNSKYYIFAALVPLFPSMAIFSYYFVGQQNDVAKLQETIIFGMISLLTYFFFLLGLLIFSKHFNIVIALLLAVGVWFVFAVGQTFVWQSIRKTYF